MNPESASFKSYRIDAFLHHLKKKNLKRLLVWRFPHIWDKMSSQSASSSGKKNEIKDRGLKSIEHKLKIFVSLYTLD